MYSYTDQLVDAPLASIPVQLAIPVPLPAVHDGGLDKYKLVKDLK